MIKINVITKNTNWYKYIKNPNSYIDKKIDKLNTKNKYYLNAVEKYTTSAFFNVSFSCKEWFEIKKSISKINYFIKPKDL